MSNDNNSNYALPDAFNVDDKTLFNIYISEYNDIYLIKSFLSFL